MILARMVLKQVQEWSLQFCYREANQAAYALAKLAYSLREDVFGWRNIPPMLNLLF